jgi:hypothetical protein
MKGEILRDRVQTANQSPFLFEYAEGVCGQLHTSLRDKSGDDF